jgi:biotin operon repressor
MRADRLLSIILLLQTRGKMTAKALAEKLEVSRRTILRDITALSSSGVPVYSEGGHGGGIALVEEFKVCLLPIIMTPYVTLVWVTQGNAFYLSCWLLCRIHIIPPPIIFDNA